MKRREFLQTHLFGFLDTEIFLRASFPRVLCSLNLSILIFFLLKSPYSLEYKLAYLLQRLIISIKNKIM